MISPLEDLVSAQSHIAMRRMSKEVARSFDSDAPILEYVARVRESQDLRPYVSMQGAVGVQGFGDSDCVCGTLPLFPTCSAISYQEVQGKMLLHRLVSYA